MPLANRTILAGLLAAVSLGIPARARAAEAKFTAHDAEVQGNKVHYTTGGHGPAVVLLHGFAETSRMWTPILPVLGEKFTVIAPDLPGIGDSDIPSEGADMRSAAILIHDLSRSLGIERASVVGHDIGLMVAYAYAALFPQEVEKLVVMDAFLPGVGDWKSIYNDPGFWHFRFHGATPEELVRGRERIYFDYLWNEIAADKSRSVPDSTREIYASAYALPGRMRAGWAYFATFPKTADDFAGLSKTTLPMPVLAMGGDKSLGSFLAPQMKLVASNVSSIVLKDCGHWMMEEQPHETVAALNAFL